MAKRTKPVMAVNDKQDSRNLLQRILGLIEKDVGHIDQMLSMGKLDKDAAADLARYSGAVLAITKDTDKVDDDQRKSLARLSDTELNDMVKQVLHNE